MMLRRTEGEAWAIVPVKRFDRAKSRLAGVLRPGERATLAKAMLGDVLEQLRRTEGLAGVAVVTGDDDARAMAADFGFETVTDPSETGVNDAVMIGVRRLCARGASIALVVPGDSPVVTADEIRSVLSALASASVALAPAARDGGTNILAMEPPDAITPAFGRDSAARHVAAAKAIGDEPIVLALAGASRDIDIAADIVCDATLAGGRRTRACLDRLDIARRLAGEEQFERATR